MTQEIVKFDPDFVNILTEGFNGKGLALPFITEIQLMECYVAGTTFREDIDEIEQELQKMIFLFLNVNRITSMTNLPSPSMIKEKGALDIFLKERTRSWPVSWMLERSSLEKSKKRSGEMIG
jgi:hypothetical protein